MDAKIIRQLLYSLELTDPKQVCGEVDDITGFLAAKAEEVIFIETENIRRVCERCGVPLLHIETDFGTADEGQIRTRIEAYLEMIRAKKEVQNG